MKFYYKLKAEMEAIQ